MRSPDSGESLPFTSARGRTQIGEVANLIIYLLYEFPAIETSIVHMNQCTRFTPCPIISASTWMGWEHTLGVPFCHASHRHTTRAHFSSIYVPQDLYERRATSHTKRASITETDELPHKGDEKWSHYELLCHKWAQITLSVLLTVSHGTEPWNCVYSVISFRGLFCKGSHDGRKPIWKLDMGVWACCKC